jgi:hypothetical protein
MSADPNIYRYEDGPVSDHGLRGDPALVAALEQRYPWAAEFGPFQLRWRR